MHLPNHCPLLKWSLMILVMASMAYAEEPVARKVTNIATTEDLLKQRQMFAQEEAKKEMTPVVQADPSTINPPQDIVSQSDILSYAGYTTLVPKRAIVQKPANFQDRYVFQKGSKVVNWQEFFLANRGWITVIEISRAQAEGKVPLAEDVQKMLSKTPNLVVATYQGGPISLLPPSPPPEPAAEKEGPKP